MTDSSALGLMRPKGKVLANLASYLEALEVETGSLLINRAQVLVRLGPRSSFPSGCQQGSSLSS